MLQRGITLSIEKALNEILLTGKEAPRAHGRLSVSDYVELTGKLPTYSEQLRRTDFPNQPFPCCFFTNPLLIPVGYGSGSFDPKRALEPKFRATNAGLLIITIEYDCRTTEELEECLRWTRGKNGDFSKSPFAAVDRELTRFEEYRGYSLVFSGNKSVHHHLIFSTEHFENASCDLSAEERLAVSQSDLMDEAHKTYWEKAAETFERGRWIKILKLWQSPREP